MNRKVLNADVVYKCVYRDYSLEVVTLTRRAFVLRTSILQRIMLHLLSKLPLQKDGASISLYGFCLTVLKSACNHMGFWLSVGRLTACENEHCTNSRIPSLNTSISRDPAHHFPSKHTQQQ